MAGHSLAYEHLADRVGIQDEDIAIVRSPVLRHIFSPDFCVYLQQFNILGKIL